MPENTFHTGRRVIDLCLPPWRVYRGIRGRAPHSGAHVESGQIIHSVCVSETGKSSDPNERSDIYYFHGKPLYWPVAREYT